MVQNILQKNIEMNPIELNCEFCGTNCGTKVKMKRKQKNVDMAMVCEYECEQCGAKALLSLYWMIKE